MSKKNLKEIKIVDSAPKSWSEPSCMLDKYVSDYRTHKEILSRLVNEKDRILDSFNKIASERDELNDVKTLISNVRDYVISKDKDRLENFINTALSDIFQRNYRLSIDESDNGWDFYFYENDNLIATSSKLLLNVGGGVSAVLGVLFRFYIGLISKNELFFMLDESFGQVSSENRARLSEYLRSFCEGTKSTVFLVSHSKELDEYAHNVYELDSFKDERGVNTLRIDEVLTNPSNTNLPRYLVNIANFQSIKEIEFGFSGFNVIRGQNNIGKSAVIRSIGSVIYGDINGIKNFIRNEPKKRGNHTNFTLSFKKLNEYRICFDTNNGSSKYEFFDENENSLGEFIGSKNSSEPVKKLLEQCGFRDALSNLKTNSTSKDLGDIAKSSVTTQFDEPYLITDKSSVINSVISMLFGAENIAMALNNANIDYDAARRKALKEKEDLDCSTEKLRLENERTQEIEANAKNEYKQALVNLNLNRYQTENNIFSLDEQIDNSKKQIGDIYSHKDSLLKAKANNTQQTLGDLSSKMGEAIKRIGLFYSHKDSTLKAKANSIEQTLGNLSSTINESNNRVSLLYVQKNSTLKAKASSVEQILGDISLKINEANKRIGLLKRDILSLYELSKTELLGRLAANDNSLVKKTSELISALRHKKDIVLKKIDEANSQSIELFKALCARQADKINAVSLKIADIEQDINAKELKLAYLQKQQAAIVKAKSDSEIQHRLSEHNAKIKRMYYGFGLAGVVIIGLVLALIFLNYSHL